jgi:hypothetical protein
VSTEAVSWNGGSGKHRDRKGRARTRIHFAGEGHEATICGQVVSANEDAEVERSALPIAIKNRSRTCDNCVNEAARLNIKAFYDPARGERF